MSFAITVTKNKVVQVQEKIKLNLKQKAFCELYVSMDKDFFGNATQCYMEAYKVSWLQANANGKKLLDRLHITDYINSLLSDQGFNDQNVDKQHLFLINQHKDLTVKMKGIEHYNKLKKRIENKLEITMPKPIMDLDEDEVIHKIDKSRVKEVKADNDS